MLSFCQPGDYLDFVPHEDSGVGYVIWGLDHATYGPVELPVLVNWIKDERVLSDTWLFLERNNCWEKASHVPELQMFFHSQMAVTAVPGSPQEIELPENLTPAALRHIKLLAGLNNEQVAQFLQHTDVLTVRTGTHVAKQGQQANAMYLLVEGELRVRSLADGHETGHGTLNAGEFFGEISLFDHGPCSTEFVAAQDCTLLRIGADDFEKFTHENPDLAAPFLFALAKTFACRFRADHKRYRDSVSYVHPQGR